VSPTSGPSAHWRWCLLPLLVAPSLAAQSPSPLEVSTRPARLTRGTIGSIVVRAARGAPKLAALAGRAEGEPLHFRPIAGGFTALIGTALEGADSVVLTLLPVRPGGERDSLDLAIPVYGGTYRHEELRVETRFATPDSAAQRRIGEEIEQARTIAREAHATPRKWTRPFQPPRPGRVTSRFGTARVLNGEVQSRHLGTDFAGKVGAPVRASNAGIVALVADFYLAGTVVYLDHGEGVVTGYFHLSKTLVETGDTVARGQVIGRVGQSGRVTGPHLHWIARYGRITVDPMTLLRLPALSR
jgi:murein DD-endopeptidase MepM/ murein hydrolase activator NlpD